MARTHSEVGLVVLGRDQWAAINMPEDASPEWVEDAARGMQFSRLKKHAKGFGQRKDFAYQLTTGML